MRRHTLAWLPLLLAVTLTGCGAPPTDDFSDLNGADEKSDAFSKKMKLVGSLDYGQTSKTALYSYPHYLAWKFAGQPGDVVDATVTSTDGTPVVWIVDNAFKVLHRENGTGASVTDEATLTANKNPDIHTYYVIVRDRDFADAHFQVQLSQAANPMFACNVDSDCVAVYQAMCCPNGTKIAVAKGYEQAYADANKCQTPPHVCPLYVINDTRVPECNRTTKTCEMVKIEDIKCGGFILNAHQCPSDYQCVYNPPGGDIPGSCQPKPPTNGCQTNADCGAGQQCSFCWGSMQCIPQGAMC